MSINIYLHFNGNCREAFELYKSILGGELEIFETFSKGPPEMNVPAEEGNNIMHVSYPIGSSVLMGSDTLSMFGPPTEIGNNFAISYASKSREETDELFAKLCEGGSATMPPADMFWGSYFGSCTDKFGINWQFNYDKE